MSAELEGLALRVQLAAFPGTAYDPAAERLLAAGLGGTCLFGSNTADGPQAVRRLTDRVHALRPGALVAVDEEAGDVTRLHARTGSPVPGGAALGAADDPALTRSAAAEVGRSLVAAGVDLDLAPVADVNSDPRNPVIGVRSFGADPDLVARHTAAWVEGLQATGVAACAKHFPGHGDTALDSHLDLPTVAVGLDVLERRELVPFAAAVRAGAASVMTSHVLVLALDPDRPATLSPAVLGVLRTRLGFGGAVVTDALDMAGASGGGRGVPRAAVLALAAGADLLCLGADKDAALVEAVRDAVVAAVRGGELAEERLRDAAARVDALADGGARRAGSAGVPDDGAWQGAAARAVRVEGRLPDLRHAVLVRLRSTPSIAVGAVPWGLPADLDVDPLDEGAAGRVLTAAHGRPLVVQVRDAHRAPGAGALLAALARARRDLVVAELGWPAPGAGRVARVCTHGASLASRDALAGVLRSAGWGR
ncbi:glycoside hydrolase family 3 N-terminal domain-containing protein [Vallicoccus soli]|uniref:Glycoside hydrolase family 3 protein n=1 Tax=Vallicoccus soli TaxID=2339232 RepID=A0A3A3Z2W9_9ACTN|nr:glycoside hydrolase family 3 N-terminal domain-containing protein [Vallicoccus soli]RJK94801.1 glycoside hydrolase family 3 protein [Vallicoccus soli]